MSENNPSEDHTTRIFWTQRRKIWTISTVGIVLPLLWHVWEFARSPGPIVISKETTWLTEPVTSSGYVDYLKFVKDRHRQHGGQSTAADIWIHAYYSENRFRCGETSPTDSDIIPLYVCPVEEFRESFPQDERPSEIVRLTADFEQTILPALEQTLWTADGFPGVAATIHQNSNWFDKVQETFTPISSLRFPGAAGSPVDAGVASIALPSTDVNRRFSSRFLLRSAYWFGSGETRRALDDVAFVYQIASRDRQFCVSFRFGLSIEVSASRLAVKGLLSAASLGTEEIQLVESFPSASLRPHLKNAAELERLMVLDSLVRTHEEQSTGDYLYPFPNRGTVKHFILSRRFCNNIDWNRLLQAENQLMDQMQNAIALSDWQQAHQKLVALHNTVGAKKALKQILTTEIWHAVPTTDDAISALPHAHSFLVDTHTSVALGQLHRRVVQITARLAVWEQREGTYPETLKQLRAVAGFSSLSDELLLDPFTGRPLTYSKSSDGFELRSAGPNGIAEDDGQLQLSAENSAVTAAGDDLIWKWPVEKAGRERAGDATH